MKRAASVSACMCRVCVGFCLCCLSVCLGLKAEVVWKADNLRDKQGNFTKKKKSNDTYNFCLYIVFCPYLNQHTAASNVWTFCVGVCIHDTHTNTANILSYSFSHSVELPLGFTGVVLIFKSPA